MTMATPQLRDFARLLVAHEMLADQPSGTTIPAPCYACEKLRLPLALLIGNAGFSALLSRSRALASVEFPWLSSLQVKADGSFEGLEEIAAQVSTDELFEGCVVLLAQLLGLLAAFIGEDLMLRLLREVWPNLSHKNFNVNEGGK
jgi:hypothetical protein